MKRKGGFGQEMGSMEDGGRMGNMLVGLTPFGEASQVVIGGARLIE
jgi:hypothetical protein